MCLLIKLQKIFSLLREPFKYYFADFVRKAGGGVPPKSVTPFSPKKKSINGGAGPGVPPQPIFWTKIRFFF